MKEYNNKISLVRNSRGVYCIDTTMGCASGMAANEHGCYNDCYAARTARRYGHDFTKTILRKFESERHKREILAQIAQIKMPFIRIGCSGDPSEDWEHTIKMLLTLTKCNHEIVIITRHWNLLTDEQLQWLSKQNICINTSVSALDNNSALIRSLQQFRRIKSLCKSVLRIISCNFNTENEEGMRRHFIQEHLFKESPIIDTVFRPSKNNPFVVNGIINIKNEIFNGQKVLASKYNRKTYMGKCGKCQEMCGVNLSSGDYPNRRGIIEQLKIF